MLSSVCLFFSATPILNQFVVDFICFQIVQYIQRHYVCKCEETSNFHRCETENEIPVDLGLFIVMEVFIWSILLTGFDSNWNKRLRVHTVPASLSSSLPGADVDGWFSSRGGARSSSRPTSCFKVAPFPHPSPHPPPPPSRSTTPENASVQKLLPQLP